MKDQGMRTEGEVFLKQWIERPYLWIKIIVMKVVPVIMVISIVFDLCDRRYALPILELIFHRSRSDFIGLGSLIFIIWTFSTTLVVFFLGCVNDRRYGIRIIDIVLAEKGAVNELFKLAIWFLLELLILFWAVLYEKEITLTVCLAVQIIWMLFFFLMICRETSEFTVRDKIVQDTVMQIEVSGTAGKLLYKMMRNIEYENLIETENFFEVMEELEARDTVNPVAKSRAVREFTSDFTEYMMKQMNDRGRTFSILGNWLTEKYSINIKRGIIKGILDNAYESCCPKVEEILDLEFEQKRDIVIWGMLYNSFYSKSIGQSYRAILSEQLKRAVHPSLNPDDEEGIWNIWYDFVSEENEKSEGGLKEMRLDILWTIMYGRERVNG